jgi:uncharacterized protein YacL
MLGRALELIAKLTLLSFLIGLMIGLMHQLGAVAVASITRAIPTTLASVAVTLMTGIFFIGLGVRVHQTITGHGGRAGREHGARERQVRLTVRRVAEGVPATTTPELPEDPDPAISMEEN